MAYLLALLAALANALSAIFQRIGVQNAPADTVMSMRLIRYAFSNIIWFAGLAMIGLVVIFGLAAIFGPPEFLGHLTVFLLACVVGYHVIWNVSPALHTPLMSVTNAISGIILVGGMVVLGAGAGTLANVLAAVAILLSAINVAGGFLVTQRMLRMFRR